MRVAVVRGEGEDFALVVSISHIVADGRLGSGTSTKSTTRTASMLN